MLIITINLFYQWYTIEMLFQVKLDDCLLFLKVCSKSRILWSFAEHWIVGFRSLL